VTVARRAALRRVAAPMIASLVALSILLALGFWQIGRKVWKEDLIAAVEQRAYGEPAAIPAERDWPLWAPARDEFRRVAVEGTFRPATEFLVGGLTEIRRGQTGQGFFVFAPLTLADGSTVMVNRGFVPTELRDPSARAEGQPSGRVTVTGLLRHPETRSTFVPANDPAARRWYSRDLVEMARSAGLDRVAPFYIDADATPNPGGWPLGGRTRLTLPNNHLGYALTWFGLAATLVGVAGVFCWRLWRSTPSRPGQDARPQLG
jgi:surfeit locus 1 family protein